jgi:hypothetical protein
MNLCVPNIQKITLYPNHTARIICPFAVFDVSPGGQVAHLHFWLAGKKNRIPGTHECYSLTMKSGETVHIEFADKKCFFGFELRVEYW